MNIDITKLRSNFVKSIEINEEVNNITENLNGTDIKTGERFIVDSVNFGDSTDVLNGKIAPGAFGYFDIEIGKRMIINEN